MLSFGRSAVQKHETVPTEVHHCVLRFGAFLIVLVIIILLCLVVDFEKETVAEGGACDERVAFEVVLDLVLSVN